MTEDWNWFFSAFAQCGAALIGIIAAFIISKLLGEIEKHESREYTKDGLFIIYSDLLKRINCRYFNWCDEITIENSSKINDAIEKNLFDDLSDVDKLQKLMEVEPSIFGTDGCISKLNQVIINYSHFPLITSGIMHHVQKEKESINDLKLESEVLIAKFLLFKQTLSAFLERIKPIKVVVYFLMFGFIVLVIYPLHFVPIKMNQEPCLGFSINAINNNLFSLRGVLLSLFTIVIEGILIYFLILISRLKNRNNKMYREIEEKHLNIKYYSKYFG